jgi:hypothetical protein
MLYVVDVIIVISGFLMHWIANYITYRTVVITSQRGRHLA